MDVFARLGSLLRQRRWLDALRLIASDRLLAALVRRYAPELVRHLAILAAMAGAEPRDVLALTSRIGVDIDEGLVRAAWRLSRGDIRGFEALAPPELRAAAELVLRLAPPGAVEEALKRLQRRYPEIAADLALYYIAEYVRRRGVDDAIVRLARDLGYEELAARLESWRTGPVAKLAEELAREAEELAKRGVIVPASAAEQLRLAARLEKLAHEYEELAKEADSADGDVDKLIAIAERMARVADEIRRVAERLRSLGAKVEIGDVYKPVRSLIAGIATLLAYYVASGRMTRAEAAAKARLLARIARRVWPEAAQLLASLSAGVSISDALCILRKALPGFEGVAAVHAAPPGRPAVRPGVARVV